MAKEDVIKMEGGDTGSVTQRHLQSTDRKFCTTQLNGRMRMHNIKVLAGDTVELEFSPYDFTRGRITHRR